MLTSKTFLIRNYSTKYNISTEKLEDVFFITTSDVIGDDPLKQSEIFIRLLYRSTLTRVNLH